MVKLIVLKDNDGGALNSNRPYKAGTVIDVMEYTAQWLLKMHSDLFGVLNNSANTEGNGTSPASDQVPGDNKDCRPKTNKQLKKSDKFKSK